MHYVAERRDMIRYPEFFPPGGRAGKSAVPARRESDVQDHYGAVETLRHALGRR